jgi:hypothetical protein
MHRDIEKLPSRNLSRPSEVVYGKPWQKEGPELLRFGPSHSTETG